MYLNPSWAKKAQRLYQNRAGWGEKRDVACWRGKADMFPGWLWGSVFLEGEIDKKFGRNMYI